ncbi:hypothetical protein FLAV_01189 [Flavobacteriales bacterium]|jgi:hypothetical protein|nr:hypothetical protein FLAV_01189 [Flavobacteriales bacterium]
MKKLIDLKENALDMNEMSMFNGGTGGDTRGGTAVFNDATVSYGCDYDQPDGSGTILYLDANEFVGSVD